MFKFFSWMSKNRVPLIIIILAIAIFILPFIILSKSCIGIINPEDSQTVLGYFGSVIGGALTLFGVWWTINDQDKKRKKELSIEFMPYLIIDFDQQLCGNIHPSIDFYIKNLGRGEAIDVIIDLNIESTFNKPHSTTCSYQFPKHINKIPKDASINIPVTLYENSKEAVYHEKGNFIINNIDEQARPSLDSYMLTFTVKYLGIMSDKIHNEKYSFNLFFLYNANPNIDNWQCLNCTDINKTN